MLAIAGLLSTVFFSGPVAAQCLGYEPKAVSLSGSLVRETHPGRPNYESIARGDEAETIWVLRLRQAVCVLTSNEEIENVKEESEKEVQLVLEPGQFKRYRNLLGKKVTITGRLFHGHTGHHHKRLLLTRSEILEARPKLVNERHSKVD